MSSRHGSFLVCELSQDTHSTAPSDGSCTMQLTEPRSLLRDKAKDYRINSVMAEINKNKNLIKYRKGENLNNQRGG